MNEHMNWSADEREQLTQELLELHFGCHEDAPALEARLANEPALRRLQTEVLAQAEVLKEAVRPEQPQLQLPQRPAAGNRGRWRLLRSPSLRLATAAAAALLVVLGLLAYERIAAMRVHAHDRDHLHLTVSAPKAVPAGAPWSFTVQAQDLTGQDVACRVRWQAFGDNGSVLAAGEDAVANGTATIALAADLQVPHRVEVIASNATDEARQVFELSTAHAGPLVHVTTDRPVYRPGEPVFVRAVVLDRVTRLPLKQTPQMTAQLLDAKDAPVGNDHSQLPPGGVGSFLLHVPEGSAGGVHTVRITAADNSFPAEQAEVVVRAFRNPQLKKDVVLDRKSYAPGARGSAQVTALRLGDGTAASGAKARAALIIDGSEVWHEVRGLDANGTATFRFVVPKEVDKGAARFVATVTDGGVVEAEVEPFVVPTGKVLVAAFPEGGELVAGVENGLYLECTDPLGRPIDSAGVLLDDRDRRVASFRTAHQGRARLAFVPANNTTYKIRLAGKADTFELPPVRERGIALRLQRDDIAAGDPLRIAVAGRGEGPWLLGVFCRGVLVGQTTVRADDDGELQTTAEVELASSASGVLRATVFDRRLQPVAERLVRRHAKERLDVALTPLHQSLAPGEQQSIGVRTTDENGRPTTAVVGLGVSDLAALSLGSEPRVGLIDQAMLFADVERMEDLGDFFLSNAASGQNVDLLLGTRGWRRFVWRNDDAAKAAILAKGEVAADILTREGFSQTPQVQSNLQAAHAAGLPLARIANRAERNLRDATGFAVALLIMLALVEAIAWLLRKSTKALPVYQGFIGVAAAAGLLFVATNLFRGQADSMAPGMLVKADVLWDGDFEGEATAVQFNTPSPPVPGIDVFSANAWNEADGLLPGMNRTVPTQPADPAGAVQLVRRFAQSDEEPNPSLLLYTGIDLPQRERTDSLLGGLGGLITTGSDDFYLGQSRRLTNLLSQRAYLQNLQQRQYAHRHTPSEDRRDFTSTIYWNTLLVTDENGNGSASFATSDAVTTWRVSADAHVVQAQATAATTGRLGQNEVTFTTELPLQIEPKLPDEVSAGDRLEIPIAAIVKDARITEVTLQTRVSEGLRLGAGAPTTIRLDNANSDGTAGNVGRGRVLLPIDVDTTVGTATIEIDARAGRFVDRVRHTVRIAPRGFPHRRSAGGRVTSDEPAEWQFTSPTVYVQGSGHVTLKVYPSPIAALTEGLEGILQEPHGCFEQASSSNYPNTLVLSLIEANGDDIPTVAARARSLLPKGYAKITGYECQQKGYEWFGHDPGHEALTAYGLLQFQDMAKVYDVDMAMVGRTRQWLLDRRDGKGNYPHGKADGHSFGGRWAPTTNAYVTYALLQSGTEPDELKVEVDALVARADGDDPYELALIACALQLAERPQAAAVRAKLASLQADDGSLPGAKGTITMSGDRDALVESTGFAVLAWLPSAEHQGNVRRAIEYLQSARSGRGTFGATQATIVALRAITAYATQNRTMREDGTLRVYEGDRLLAERAFHKTDVDAIEIDLWNQLAPGEHTLRLEVEGSGGTPLPWTGELAYHAELPADDADSQTAITTQLRAASIAEGQTVALDVTVENRTDAELPTPIAIIGLPAGLELPTKVLEDMLAAERFAFWELQGRELVLYWRKLDAGQKCELTFDLIAGVPGTTTGPASRTYLYYTPDQKRWAQPLSIEVTATR